MKSPRDMDTSYTGVGQFIHRRGFQAIGGLTLVTKHVNGRWHIGLYGTKEGRQDLSFGHEQTLDIVESVTGIACIVGRVRGPENNPNVVSVFTTADGWTPTTDEDFIQNYLDKNATRK